MHRQAGGITSHRLYLEKCYAVRTNTGGRGRAALCVRRRAGMGGIMCAGRRGRAASRFTKPAAPRQGLPWTSKQLEYTGYLEDFLY